MNINKELRSDLAHLSVNLDYFSDIELGRLIREVLEREIKIQKKCISMVKEKRTWDE